MELNTRLSAAAPSQCRRAWWPGLSALAALFVVFLASPAAVEAQGNHGIGTAKGCQSPVKVGDPLNCSIVVTNNQDGGNGTLGSADTLTVLSVVDWVCTDVAPPGCIGGAGNPNSGNIIQTVTKSFLGGSSCGVDPMDMVYKCTLPPGSSIAFGTIANPHSFYTVQPGDPDPLPDVASISWLDTCSSGANNCPQPPTAPLFATASSSVVLTCPTCGTCNECNESTNACETDEDQLGDACTPGTGINMECRAPACVDSNGVGVCANGQIADPTQNGNDCVNAPASNECQAPACLNGTCTANQKPDPAEVGLACGVDANLCENNICNASGACVVDPTTVVDCTDGTCYTAECVPATGLCGRTCDATRSAACEVCVSNCIWREESDPANACQDVADDGCPGTGVPDVDVDLIRCADDTIADMDSTDGDGNYEVCAPSINLDPTSATYCEPVTQQWQVVVDRDEFVNRDDPACNDTTDSDCCEAGDPNCTEVGATACTNVDPATDTMDVDCGVPGGCDCLLIIDEEGLDNDFRSVERFAQLHSTLPSYLINDDCQDNGQVCPTGFGDGEVPNELGNPWLLWNIIGAGDIVKLPTGQDDDEGWYMLPPEDQLPWTYQQFVDGLIPQSALDKIPNVMPLRNQDIESLVGRTCLAIVYDSDISINYQPLNANLQGERYGKFAFTLLAVETPGSVNGDPYPQVLPESKSSTSLYDVWIRVEADEDRACLEAGLVDIHDHEPDACQITKAVWNGSGLSILGESDRGGTNGTTTHKAFMTFSIDNTDIGANPAIDPIFLEQPMSLVPGTKRYRFISAIFPVGHPDEGDPIPNLVGRRISIQTDEGCTYNGRVRSR